MTATTFPVVIGVGASAGGVEALMELTAALPADFGAPVLVVLHVSRSGTSVLDGILDRRSPMHATMAQDGEPLCAGCIYVAPPDHHLLVEDGRVSLGNWPPVSNHRPAIDPMLESIASAYGPEGVGVILSGTLDDGALGLRAIKDSGGRAFVQDPEEALYAAMPRNAMNAVEVDGCLPLALLAERLIGIARPTPRDTPSGCSRTPTSNPSSST